MAELTIALPNGQVVNLLVPDGDQRVRVKLEQCPCGCERWFQPTDSNQIYLNEDHRIDYHNRRRRKSPTRPGSP